MRASRRSSGDPSAVSPWRVLGALLVVALTFWWLNWVRVGAAPSEADEADLAAAPSGDEASSEAEAGPAGAGEESGRVLLGMEERVSLDLRSTEVADALKYLATKGGLNISLSKNVSGRVNLLLADVPIRDVFDIMLRTNDLAYDTQGNVYNVMTEDEYQKLYGKRFSDLRQVKTFRLQYAIPQQAFNLLDTMKSEVGRLLVDEDSGTVMVMDTPERLREMDAALSTLEQSGTVRVVGLKYATAIDIEERLKDQLELNKLGFIKADARSNQVIVKAFPDRMREIEQLIQALDRKTREVLIDAKIIKVTYIRGLDAGVDWDAIFANLKFHGIDQVGDFRQATTGTAPAETVSVSKTRIPTLDLSPLGDNFKLGSLAFGTVARDGYELFRYLQTLGKTQIISNPRILVTENHEAKIHVGTREAYVTTTTTTGQTTATTAEEVEFIDVGIQLAVTPSINEDGYVTMKIKPEVSSVVRTLTTPSRSQIPIVDTSTAETNVMVSDGTTVVLGGLRKDEKKATDKQVPYLGNLPLVGKLFFRDADHDSELTELVVFITPHIIQGNALVTGDEAGKLRGYRDYAPVLSQRSADE